VCPDRREWVDSTWPTARQGHVTVNRRCANMGTEGGFGEAPERSHGNLPLARPPPGAANGVLIFSPISRSMRGFVHGRTSRHMGSRAVAGEYRPGCRRPGLIPPLPTKQTRRAEGEPGCVGRLHVSPVARRPRSPDGAPLPVFRRNPPHWSCLSFSARQPSVSRIDPAPALRTTAISTEVAPRGLALIAGPVRQSRSSLP